MYEEGSQSEKEAGATLIDYSAIDSDPGKKQPLSFLLIELNTFYGANRWKGGHGGE